MLAGSGRLFVSADNQSAQQQAFYGLRETIGSTRSLSDLVDVTDVEIDNGGAILDENYAINGVSVTQLSQVDVAISQADGWVRRLSNGANVPSGRVVEPAAILEDTLLFTEYVPNGLLCEPSGDSVLWGLDVNNGIRGLDAGLAGVNEEGEPQIVTRVRITAGLAFTPLIHSSTGEFGGDQVIVADDKGGYTLQSILLPSLQGGRESWRQVVW